MTSAPDSSIIAHNVQFALAEDIGGGDVTAQLIDETQTGHARIITRENAVFCGRPWVDEVFKQLDPSVEIDWHTDDGEQVAADATVFELRGRTRSLLTGERTALNFVQLLSGTATRCNRLAQLVDGTPTRLLDTRKTIPGLRMAQKYAVLCGGCHNHRIGLYDAFLIKENHIHACGGIIQAITTARKNHPNLKVEVEVETIDEFRQAVEALPDVIMLDNFGLGQLRQAVAERPPGILLEVSGGIDEPAIREIAATGIDYISIGALTKHVRAVDLSMRMVS